MAYFRVSLEAARAIADATGDPQLIAAYMVLRRFAYTDAKDRSAAGANAISEALDCSDYKSKRLLSDLLALRFGERGTDAAAMTAAEWNATHGKQWSVTKGNARVHVLPDWPGELAYLPDLILAKPFARLCAADDQEIGCVALLALLHLYRQVSYADFMGAAPDRFAFMRWDFEGTRTLEFDYELGHMGSSGKLRFWRVSPAESGQQWAYPKTMEAVTGGATDAHKQRFFDGLQALIDGGLVCPVAVVFSGDPAAGRGRMLYPLWIFRPEYRRALEGLGISGELAMLVQKAADSAGLGDEYLIRDVTTEDHAHEGTGIYHCASEGLINPTVLTLYAPRLHAPTVQNMEGLAEVAKLTRSWALKLKRG